MNEQASRTRLAERVSLWTSLSLCAVMCINWLCVVVCRERHRKLKIMMYVAKSLSSEFMLCFRLTDFILMLINKQARSTRFNPVRAGGPGLRQSPAGVPEGGHQDCHGHSAHAFRAQQHSVCCNRSGSRWATIRLRRGLNVSIKRQYYGKLVLRVGHFRH